MFYVRLAGCVIGIDPLYEEIRTLCKPYCVSEAVPDFTVHVSAEDLEQEERLTRRNNKITGVPLDYTPDYLETIAVYRKIASAMPAFDSFVMHGSVVSTQGQGYMFTAPSGVGKTTRTRLWLDAIPGSEVINGDKPILRVTEQGVYAYGTPWCGKEGWQSNISAPLRAVFLLERAEDGRENELRELSQAEAFPLLLRQTYMPAESEARQKVLQLLRTALGKMKVYWFCSERTPEAVRLAWETARKNE